MSADGSSVGWIGRGSVLRPATAERPVADEQTPDYAAFFRREFPRVVRTVYLVVRDAERSEELTQEAFIQVLRNWKRVSGYEWPEAWVRRVAIRLAIRDARRERLRSILERKAVGAQETTVGSTDAALTSVLKKLPLNQRIAITLHYYEDRPIDEIAQILACSPNTVKSHLHRGRRSLRGLLDEEEDD